MRSVLLLAWVNEIDLAVDALRVRMGEIAEALKEPVELQRVREACAGAEAELTRCRAAQQEREAVQREAGGRLAQAESNLYSGKVRNPKELQDAERDVAQLRRQYSQAEDRLLDTLIALESASESVTAQQAELARLTTEWGATQTRLRREQAQVRERLLAEQARQVEARRAVPADLLTLYDGLRARRSGRAVAELDEDSCSVCRVAVPPGKLEMARYGEELTYCENCGRLLWGE
jgi:predicted  nucleic acid-binding Zn-ribbon protein